MLIASGAYPDQVHGPHAVDQCAVSRRVQRLEMPHQRVELVERRIAPALSELAHLDVAEWPRRLGQAAMAIVRAVNPDRGEARRKALDLAQKVLRSEAILAE